MSELFIYENDDSAMNQAVQLAQENYHEFVSALAQDAQRESPKIKSALVKYAFVTGKPDITVEHMFLGSITYVNGVLHGMLISDPQYLDHIQAFDIIEIEQQHISDWIYVDDAGSKGGYTFKVILSQFTAEEKKLYGNVPPYAWLS